MLNFIVTMESNYDNELLELRPLVAVELNGEKKEDEQFMHDTLRPILKQNHDKINAIIKASKHFNKNELIQKPISERHLFLKNLMNKNGALKNLLIGINIGFFTSEEMKYYLENQTELNKRISEMVVVRFISNL